MISGAEKASARAGMPLVRGEPGGRGEEGGGAGGAAGGPGAGGWASFPGRDGYSAGSRLGALSSALAFLAAGARRVVVVVVARRPRAAGRLVAAGFSAGA